MTTTDAKQSKTWVIAGAALLALIGVIAWVVARPSTAIDELATPEPATEPAAPAVALKAEPTIQAKIDPPAADPVAPAPAAPAPVPVAAPPVDLFAGEMPDFMVDLHARVLEKRYLSVKQQKQLYDWGKAHKDDARPQLLLAWDSRNRDWDGMAINVYGIAFRADPRATQDLNNLRDLVSLASNHQVDRTEFNEATDIVKTHFGLQALPVIDEELEKLNASGDIARATRLSQLRDRLRGH